MNIERTQHIGHYGVTFTVLRLIVLPANRHALANLCLLAGTFSAPIRPFSKPMARAVSTTVGVATKSFIRTYHAGDVIIGIEAQVEGGIGPQRSESAMVIPFMGGTPQ